MEKEAWAADWQIACFMIEYGLMRAVRIAAIPSGCKPDAFGLQRFESSTAHKIESNRLRRSPGIFSPRGSPVDKHRS